MREVERLAIERRVETEDFPGPANRCFRQPRFI
jgi:hypothetical protein